MGTALCSLFGHKWNGCTCTRCSFVRNEEHIWNGCVCVVCGEVRDQDHSFELIPDSYKKWEKDGYGGGKTVFLDYHVYRCNVCKEARSKEAHTWKGQGCMTECSVCGARPRRYIKGDTYEGLDISHVWSGNTCTDKCSLCGQKNIDGAHSWTGNTCKDTCSLCGKRYPDGHKYEEIETTVSSYGTKIGTFRCIYCGEEHKEPYDCSSSDSV